LKSSLIFVLFTVTALVLSACAPVSEEDFQSTVEVAIALTALAQTAAAPAVTTAAPPAPTAEATAEATLPPPAEDAGPEVVFLAEGSFSTDEKAQLRSRVIEPFILYYHELADHPPLLTITIEKSTSLAGYPYSAQAIFETGINVGWLVPATGALVDWWFPDCMGPCPLSDNFRAAYPEIVAILEP